jgi:hypothetical protein
MSDIKRVRSASAFRLEKTLKDSNTNKVGKVGWFESAVYKKGTSVATVAAQNEFGNPTKNIPPRSFMRTSLKENESLLRAIANNQAKKIVNGAQSAEGALEIITVKYAMLARKKITEITEPPLKPATIAARVRKMKDKKTIGLLNKPLVETKVMLNTLTHVVENQ